VVKIRCIARRVAGPREVAREVVAAHQRVASKTPRMLITLIFGVLAIIVVVAFVLQLQRRRDYERSDDDLG
jgi:hypothetical protein